MDDKSVWNNKSKWSVKSSKKLIIFSGYNQRAVIAFLRCLTQYGVSNYCIIASSCQDEILLTTYANKVEYIRNNKELSVDLICECFDDILGKNELGIIIPSTEALIRFYLSNREVFETHRIYMPVVDEQLYVLISDKNAFWKYCKGKGFLVPRLYDSCLKVPCVAKPKKYCSDKGKILSPVIIKTNEELDRFIEKYDIEDFDFQEYLDGESYYLLYYIKQDGEVLAFSQRNILQQPNGKSILAAEPCHLHELEPGIKYGGLLSELNFRGLVMIELRKVGDLYYMIEANPRLWGPSQLLIDANVPFFGYYLKDIGFPVDVDNTTINYNIKYYWKGGRTWENDRYFYNSKEELDNYIQEYEKYELYNRPDTMKVYIGE